MEAMWINFECKRDKFVVRPFLGGVNGISGESTIGDMGSLLRRMNTLSNAQDYLVLPEQPWLDGISTAPGIVKQFVAAETAPPRDTRDPLLSGQMSQTAQPETSRRSGSSSSHVQSERKHIVAGASVEWQVTGSDAVGGIQLQIIPTFKVDSIFAGSVKDTCYAGHGSTRLISYNKDIEESARAFDVLKTTRELGLGDGDTIYMKDLRSRKPNRPKTMEDLLQEASGRTSADGVLDITVRYTHDIPTATFKVSFPGRNKQQVLLDVSDINLHRAALPLTFRCSSNLRTALKMSWPSSKTRLAA